MGRDSESLAADILPGTLVMLILQTLARRGPLHGYGIVQHIRQMTESVLTVEEGALYPALQRMLARGWVMAEWRLSDNNRRARFYTLTDEGRQQLQQEVRDFERSVHAITRVIRPLPAEA